MPDRTVNRGDSRSLADKRAHRSGYTRLYGGGRAGRGLCGRVCVLLARVRGRAGARRERDHGPAGARHDRRPRLRQFDGRLVRGTHRLPVPSLARWLLGLGIAATLTANMAQGWSHGPVGAVVAAWPAVSLVGSYELLVWLIRTAGTLEQGPPAEPDRNGAPCCALVRPLPAATADEGQRSHSDREAPRQTPRPTSQPAAHPAPPANVQNDDEVTGADTVNDQAVAAYRLSLQAGSPLSERKLASMFGRTSRRWARTRITEARRATSGRRRLARRSLASPRCPGQASTLLARELASRGVLSRASPRSLTR
jgi:hypothetical protein